MPYVCDFRSRVQHKVNTKQKKINVVMLSQCYEMIALQIIHPSLYEFGVGPTIHSMSRLFLWTSSLVYYVTVMQYFVLK